MSFPKERTDFFLSNLLMRSASFKKRTSLYSFVGKVASKLSDFAGDTIIFIGQAFIQK